MLKSRSTKAREGHSDGDVLCHALCDALLGAASLGDIGTHFPDTDPKWKGASSLIFLEHVRKMLADRRLRIVHVDAIVICERPKLGPHFPAMRAALAKSLGITTGADQPESQNQRRHRRNRPRRSHRSARDCHDSAALTARFACNCDRISVMTQMLS